MSTDSEYASSVTLIILGTDLDPDTVSEQLSLTPSKQWHAGEYRSYTRPDGTTRIFNSKYDFGGWKRFVEPGLEDESLESQLEYWCKLLLDRREALKTLKASGCECILDLFLATDASVLLKIPEQLQKSLASLGIDLEIYIMAC